MLDDIFWNKCPCDNIGLKSFSQVVSCELDFKNKSAFAKGIQYWGYVSLICILSVKEFKCYCISIKQCECCYPGVIKDFPLYHEPKKDFKIFNILFNYVIKNNSLYTNIKPCC